MSEHENGTSNLLHRRIHGELVDSLDEELELEIDDERLASLLSDAEYRPSQETVGRQFYFREIILLQRELVKLQDWVVHRKLKVVIIFEGRDAAGKGGVIKRISQRLNPRCSPCCCSAGTQRTRALTMVFSTLRSAPSCRRGDRSLRPQLV